MQVARARLRALDRRHPTADADAADEPAARSARSAARFERLRLLVREEILGRQAAGAEHEDLQLGTGRSEAVAGDDQNGMVSSFIPQSTHISLAADASLAFEAIASCFFIIAGISDFSKLN